MHARGALNTKERRLICLWPHDLRKVGVLYHLGDSGRVQYCMVGGGGFLVPRFASPFRWDGRRLCANSPEHYEQNCARNSLLESTRGFESWLQ
jgi:hypothetical protein